LQQAWARYHLARDGLRRQLSPLAAPGFAARVLLAIEREAAPLTVAKRSHWLRWSAGGAIAASVAAAALMVGQPGVDTEHAVAVAAQQSATLASAASTNRTATPAAVPSWLSGNSAGLLSQQASVTLGAPFAESASNPPQQLSAYPSLRRYRTLSNRDGSYLLLLDPGQPATLDGSRQAAAVAH
jgi:sigma-E factor negative regulatory protein RseA